MAASDDNPLREAMKRVAVTLKDAGIRFALAGGYAAWARGGPEPGHDADIFLTEEDVAAAIHVLEDAGFKIEHPVEDWLVKVFEGEQMIDLIHHPYGRPVTREMLGRAEEMRVGSVDMPVLSATDLVVALLLAMHEHYADLAGVLPVVRALREQVDWAEVRERTAESPYAAAFFTLGERLNLVPPARGGARS